MSEAKIGTCGSCKHYSIDAKDVRQGMCKRFPPQGIGHPTPQGGWNIAFMFPIIGAAEKCGEQTPKVTLQ